MTGKWETLRRREGATTKEVGIGAEDPPREISASLSTVQVGYSHDDTEEIYLLVEGKGEIQLGDREKEDAVSGDIVMIPRGIFHRVLNKVEGDLTFISFFEKYQGRGK